MRTISTFIILSLLSVSIGFSVTHTVTNSGFTFSPSNISINLGDTVKFVLASIHNAVEVTQATWDANGNTSNGGFSTQFGGGTVIPQEARTYYYVCSPHASFGMKGSITINAVTGVTSGENNFPSVFKLSQNFPNPFNPSTRISFTVPEPSEITLKVYNLLGAEIQTLAQGIYSAGAYKKSWDASNVSAGIYFYRLQAHKLSADKSENYTETKRMILVK